MGWIYCHPPRMGNLLLTTESEKSSQQGGGSKEGETQKKWGGQDAAFDVSKFHGYGRKDYQL